MKNWDNREIEVAHSEGGVIAVLNPFDNLISTGITPWPPAEVLQKLYLSHHVKAFAGADLEKATRSLGYYCDLQSIHSEDAITWSVFGTVARSEHAIRNKWVSDFFSAVGLVQKAIKTSEIFLWRRTPHPDTLVPGGPEVDFGILTNDAVVLGEAKWQSAIGTRQGKGKGKDQIELRSEFLHKLGKLVFPTVDHFAVLGISLSPDMPHAAVSFPDVQVLTATWDCVCSIASHPLVQEVQRYLAWKKANTRMVNNALHPALLPLPAK